MWKRQFTAEAELIIYSTHDERHIQHIQNVITIQTIYYINNTLI